MSEREVELPIRRVTAYEDRAEVVREGTVELAGGSETLVLRAVSPLVSQDRLVAVLGSGKPDGDARISDVRVEHLWIEDERPAGARLRELEARVRAAEDEARTADEVVDRLLARHKSLEKTASRWAAELGRALARGADSPTTDWKEGFTAFEDSQAALGKSLAEARARAAEAAREVRHLRDLVAKRRPREMRYVGEIRLTVSGEPGRARLTVSYVVPCALWRPSHEAHLIEGGEEGHTVAWTLHATLWQKTGEDWNDVELTLSTARPSAGGRLPRLGADLLRLREKSREEKKTIRVEHRHEEVPRADLSGAAPGVYDGGRPRELAPAGPVGIPSDGRPHRVAAGSFASPARLGKLTFPELDSHVFHRAALRNLAGAPLLAGPVTLLAGGSWVGIGDLPYVAEGEELDLSFGSDDRFTVVHRRRRLVEERALGRDRVHYVTEVDLSYSGAGEETLTVVLRLPRSELGQLKVVPSEKWCRPWPVEPDGHGHVRVPVRLSAGAFEKVSLGFRFETSGEVDVPDPW